MGDRPGDDTREPTPQPRREREPGGYYYDDQTGYEIYDPVEDEDSDNGEGNDEVTSVEES